MPSAWPGGRTSFYFTFPNAACNAHFVMPTFPHAKVELKIAIKKKKNHSLPLHKRNASRMWDYTTETDLRIAFPSLLISDLATGGSYLFLISCLMLLSYFCMSLRSLCSAHICHVVRLCSSLCPDFFFPLFSFCIKSISKGMET